MESGAVADLPAPLAQVQPSAVSPRNVLRWRVFAALVCVPALWVAWIIFTYSVNTPSYDEWVGIAPIFQKLEAGTLHLGDFTVPHNEHRMFVPRVIMFLTGLATHWDTRWEVALTWLVLLTIAANLWKLLEATGWKPRGETCALFGVLGLLVINPLQEQNLIFGFQFHFVLPLAFITAGYQAAVRLRRPVNFLVAAALASAASFSMAAGLIAWLLILPLLIQRPLRTGWRDKWIAGWLVLFALHAAVFALGFHQPQGAGGGAVAMLKNPGAGAQYLLAFLGAPFASGIPFGVQGGITAMAIGAALVLWTASVAGALWFRRQNPELLLQRTLPWIMVSATGFASGLLTTVGRFHYGPNQALETRYIPYATLVPTGLLVLTVLLLKTVENRRVKLGVLGFASAFLFLHLVAVANRLEVWPALKHRALYARAVVQAIDVTDEPDAIFRTSPEPEHLRETARSLSRTGFLQPPLIPSKSIAAIGDAAAQGDGAYGSIDLGQQKDNWVGLIGWAILPDRLEPADAVLLTCDDAQGVPNIIALVRAFEPRPDVVSTTGKFALGQSGWRRMVNLSELPAGLTGPIKAWSYDAEQSRAWRLTGSVQIQR